MPSDRNKVQNLLQGLVSSNASITDAEEAVRQAVGQIVVEYNIPYEAEGVLGESPVGSLKTIMGDSSADTVELEAAYIIAGVTAAVGGTNYITVTVSKYDSAGANKTTIASGNNNTGGTAFTAFVPTALTVASGGGSIAADSSFSLTIAKTGSGDPIAAATGQAKLVLVFKVK